MTSLQDDSLPLRDTPPLQALHDSLPLSVQHGACVVLAVLLTVLLWRLRGEQHAPPGPWGWPVVGNLLQLDPRQPHETLRQLCQRYGPVYQLYLGGVRAVVLAREDLIRTTFALEGATGRAPLYLTFGIMNGKGLICSEGEVWREHRRFALGVMRALGMRSGAASTALENRILRAAEDTAKTLGDPDSPTLVSPAAPLLHTLGNSMNLLVFGVEYDRQDPVWLRLQQLLEEGTRLIGVAGAINFLPWLRFLPYYRRIIKFIKENQIKSHAVYQELIDEFKASEESKKREGEESHTESPKHYTEGPKHYVDAYLKEVESRGVGMEGSFTPSQLHHVAADLFGAGTETTHTTLRWLLLDLAAHQPHQHLVHTELVSVSAGKGYITSEDLPQLLYTQAAVLETQRLHPVVPLGVPHGATKDLQIEGYNVPRGTMLIPLIALLHMDPKHWTAPDQYRPGRFLDPDTGQLLRHPSFMPFQIGRRSCPGEAYARLVILLYLSQLLLHYRLVLPRDWQRLCQNDNFLPLHDDSTDLQHLHDDRTDLQHLHDDRTNLQHLQHDRTDLQHLHDDRTDLQHLHDDHSGSDDGSVSNERRDVGNIIPLKKNKEKIKTISLEGLNKLVDLIKEEDIDTDPFSDPICGFTTAPRPYKLILVPRTCDHAAAVYRSDDTGT